MKYRKIITAIMIGKFYWDDKVSVSITRQPKGNFAGYHIKDYHPTPSSLKRILSFIK